MRSAHPISGCRCQEIDLFGEIGGISFSPDGYGFFLSVADVVYSSLMQFISAETCKSNALW
jgi:hypothetical protein